jgi:hypothetical protein
MSKSTPKVDCNICASEVSQRRIVACSYCHFEACDTCVSTFLLGIGVTDPFCMNPECKKNWSVDFIATRMPSDFLAKFRDHTTNIIYQHEMNMLPETMPYGSCQR